jgi:hypothetical protein
MVTRRDPVERVVDALVAIPVSIAAVVREVVPGDGARLDRVIARDLDLLRRYGPARPRPSSRAIARASDTFVHDVPEPMPGDDVDAPDPHAPSVGSTAAVDAAVDAALPIEGYDQLSARQIVDRLGALTADELAAVAAHEASHRRRQTILGRIEQLS